VAGAPWRGRPQALLFIVVAAMGLLTCVTLIVFDARDTGFISAYHAASKCSSPADAMSGDTCRYQGEAQVLSTSADAGHKTIISFQSLPGRELSTFFPTGGEPDSSALQAGGTAQAELWSGKVTRLAGKVTNDDPEEYPTSGLIELSAFLAVLALPLLAVGIVSARSA